MSPCESFLSLLSDVLQATKAYRSSLVWEVKIDLQLAFAGLDQTAEAFAMGLVGFYGHFEPFLSVVLKAPVASLIDIVCDLNSCVLVFPKHYRDLLLLLVDDNPRFKWTPLGPGVNFCRVDVGYREDVGSVHLAMFI